MGARRRRRRHLPAAISKAIRDPARFRAVADKAAPPAKPLIVAKVGRSEAGRRAAASHTGALAHAGAADDAIFRHHGIIRGEDLDHMVDVATAFAYCPLPRGNRVAIITGSGGSAVWMADILSAHGLELPVLEDDIQRRIMALLPSYGSAQNPIDATAQAIGEVGYAPLVELVRESERIDTILLIGSLANDATANKRAEELADLTGPRDKPILLSTYTGASPAAIAAFAAAGIPCYTSMPSCARAIRALVDYGAFQARLHRPQPPATAPSLREDDGSGARRCRPGSDRERGKGTCSPATASRARPRRWRSLRTKPQRSRRRIGGAVALKVQSPDITAQDRGRRGGAAQSPARRAVREGYRAVLARAQAAHPGRADRGRARADDGAARHEIILGITRDPDFGPMLMVGLGGIHVEVLRDVAFAPVPLGPDEALVAARPAERRGPARRRARRPAGRPRRTRRTDGRAVALCRRPRRGDRRNRPQPGHRPSAGPGPDRRRCADRQAPSRHLIGWRVPRWWRAVWFGAAIGSKTSDAKRRTRR